MKYENITAFKIITKVSKSKVYRFYKKNVELWRETKLKTVNDYFHLTMLDILTPKSCSMRTKS